MVSIVPWDSLWKTMLLSTHRGQLFTKDFWEKNVSESKNHNTDLTDGQLSRLQLCPECTVLEIGAGTGRIALPIAKRVKQVTAVEPSINRLNFLKETAQKENVANMVFVGKPWEEIIAGIDVLPHDVVLSSFSLFMADTESALKKIDTLAKKRAYIFLSASKSMTDELQKIIYGRPLAFQMTDYIFVYNILHDMGIPANVEVWRYSADQSFSSLDEVVTKFMEDYNLPPKKEPDLREYLQSVLVNDGEGRLLLRRKKNAAMITWAKDNFPSGCP